MNASDTPAVSVVAATKDRPRRLQALLASLRAQTLPHERFEVIVVDDGSAAATQAVLEREARAEGVDIRPVLRAVSAGPAAARNEGWRAARAPLVAFTDDDCEASPQWLERLLVASQRAPEAIIQGRTTPIPRELDSWGPFSRTIRVEERGPFFQTCNILYPRALLERLGGFDERLMFVEDADLAWRALEAGVAIEFEEEALVHHAVENLGPAGLLRVALRWTDVPYVLGCHPGLRAQTRWRRFFWKRSHYLLTLAATGLIVSRWLPAGAILATPYGRELVRRSRDTGVSPAVAPYFVLHDLCETISAIRGGFKHRVLVL